MSLIVDEHREYLADRLRVETFARAVAATVRPGDVVVDIGTGTGFLALLACRAGARRVYAIEANGMIEIAREVARANGLADRITFIHRHSLEVALPEPADVLLADLVGGMGFEAGLFQTYADARRFLKRGARVLPARLALGVAPIESPSLFGESQFWSQPVADFDMKAVLRWAANTGYPRVVPASDLLSQQYLKVEPDAIAGDQQIRIEGTTTVDRQGVLHGLAGWFEAELAPGVTLSNSPHAHPRFNRRNVFFPLDEPTSVRPGDEIAIVLRIRPSDKMVSWDVTIGTGPGARRERHSTLSGMLLTREDLQSHAPASIPRLTPRGLARRSVLELCDGRRPLRAIEEEVFARHPDLFNRRGDAQAFVAEVVARYSEDGA